MTERSFQINVERQLNNIIPSYNETIKFPSDTLFHFINKAKDEYVKQNFRVFQRNQEITDNIRTLVNTKSYTTYSFSKLGNKWEADYPEDYMFALGENVYISIKDNKCNNLITRESDVIEATIETVSSRLSNSLSDHKLRYNQAKPIRVYTDNKIVLYTDGKYDISSYELTYLRKAKDLGTLQDLTKEYTDLPENTHQDIVDLAVQMIVQTIPNASSKKSQDE